MVEILVSRLDDEVPAAVVRPSRRRRRRPHHHRRRPPRAGGAGAGAHRDRGRAPRGVRRPGAPPLRAGGPVRGVDRQRPGHRRRGLPRRDQGDADQPRPARAGGARAAATGSPSSWSSRSSTPGSSRSTALPDSVRGDGGYGSTGGFLSVVPDPGDAPPDSRRRRSEVPAQVRAGRVGGRSRRGDPGDPRGLEAAEDPGSAAGPRANGPWDITETDYDEDDRVASSTSAA